MREEEARRGVPPSSIFAARTAVLGDVLAFSGSYVMYQNGTDCTCQKMLRATPARGGRPPKSAPRERRLRGA